MDNADYFSRIAVSKAVKHGLCNNSMATTDMADLSEFGDSTHNDSVHKCTVCIRASTLVSKEFAGRRLC